MNYWLNKKAFFYIVNFLNSLTYVLRRGSFEKCSWSSTITRLIKSIWSVVANFVETLKFRAKPFIYDLRTKPRKVGVFKFLTLVVYTFTNLLPWGSVQTRWIKQNKKKKHLRRWPVNRPLRFFRRKYLKPSFLPQKKNWTRRRYNISLISLLFIDWPIQLDYPTAGANYVFIYANSPGWPKTTR